MQNMVEMPLIDSEYSISFSEHKVVLEDEAADSTVADSDDDNTDVDSVFDYDSASVSEPESEHLNVKASKATLEFKFRVEF